MQARPGLIGPGSGETEGAVAGAQISSDTSRVATRVPSLAATRAFRKRARCRAPTRDPSHNAQRPALPRQPRQRPRRLPPTSGRRLWRCRQCTPPPRRQPHGRGDRASRTPGGETSSGRQPPLPQHRPDMSGPTTRPRAAPQGRSRVWVPHPQHFEGESWGPQAPEKASVDRQACASAAKRRGPKVIEVPRAGPPTRRTSSPQQRCS